MTKKTFDASQISEVIQLAWCDKTSFEHILHLTGLTESDVKEIMRKNLKPNSYRLWRKRVTGRASKRSSLHSNPQQSP